MVRIINGGRQYMFVVNKTWLIWPPQKGNEEENENEKKNANSL